MSKHTPGGKTGRPLPVSGKISRIIQSLAGASPNMDDPEPDDLVPIVFSISEQDVDRVLQTWQARAQYFPPELVSDPVWGMLLELLLAELQGRRVSLARICNVSSVPTSTAIRWLNSLERRELATRRADAQNADHQFVELLPKGRSALQRYFHEIFGTKIV